MIDKLISSVVAFLVMLIPVPADFVGIGRDDKVSIIFTGDIMLGRSVMGAALDNNDPFYPFRKTSDFLKSSDITFSNLENPIVKDCPRHSGGFKFCTNYDVGKGLGFAGVDIVSLANNHTLNYGITGRDETNKFLSDMGIDSVGYGNLVIKEVNGVKLGFMGFDYVTNRYDFFEENDDWFKIEEADKKVDILIVGVHWGQEYKDKADSNQRKIARRMVDSGADVIIGHHPHWVQDKEVINGKPIYYSLGNFVFDQMWSEETKKGLLVKMTFEGSNLVNTEEFKTYIPLIGQPEIVE